jgi:hypothetical protein
VKAREWFVVLESVEENEDGSICWADGVISTHAGGNLYWQDNQISFVEKKEYDALEECVKELHSLLRKGWVAGCFAGDLKDEVSTYLSKDAR